MSEGLHYDRIQQGHVLSSSDRQLVCSVVVDDLWDGAERRAVLPEHVTPLRRPSELHVHEALTAPDRERRKKKKKKRSTSSRLIHSKECCDIHKAKLKVRPCWFYLYKKSQSSWSDVWVCMRNPRVETFLALVF